MALQSIIRASSHHHDFANALIVHREQRRKTQDQRIRKSHLLNKSQNGWPVRREGTAFRLWIPRQPATNPFDLVLNVQVQGTDIPYL